MVDNYHFCWVWWGALSYILPFLFPNFYRSPTCIPVLVFAFLGCWGLSSIPPISIQVVRAPPPPGPADGPMPNCWFLFVCVFLGVGCFSVGCWILTELLLQNATLLCICQHMYGSLQVLLSMDSLARAIVSTYKTCFIRWIWYLIEQIDISTRSHHGCIQLHHIGIQIGTTTPTCRLCDVCCSFYPR